MARSRPVRRSPQTGGLLVLPAVVMTLLGGAFVVWFMMGAPESRVTPWQDSPDAPVRPAVQAPQLASTPPLTPLRPSTMIPAPPQAPIPEPAPAQPDPIEASSPPMALALQPTPQISTPAAMRSVLSEPQQISAPEQDARTAVAPPFPARRATAPTAPPPPVSATLQPPKALPAAPSTPTPSASSDPAPPVAEGAPAARRTYSIVLARVETEGEARAKLGPLKQKFGTLLGGHRLSYQRVKEDGVYIWRVRSPGLTEDDASEICEKIESAGGDCAASPQ